LSGQVVIKRVPDDLGNFTALTPAVQQRFLDELAKGDWPQLAAFRAGIAPKSVKRWLDKGLEDCAIEPYASFAAEVVRLEAELAGKLIHVVMQDALGETPEPDEGKRRPNVQTAQWLLQNRFRFFWGTKDGLVSPAALSIAEHVERQMASLDETKRNAARKILAALPNEARTEARKAGFLL
jgi:hypothetical protein